MSRTAVEFIQEAAKRQSPRWAVAFARYGYPTHRLDDLPSPVANTQHYSDEQLYRHIQNAEKAFPSLGDF